MKKRLLIVAVLAALAGAAFWMQHGSWLSARLRGPVQDALSRALGREVRVAGVGGGLRGWLWLRGVSVGPAPGASAGLSATARALGLKLDFSDLLRGRVSLADLKAVQVLSPTVYVFDAAPVPRGAPTAPPSLASNVPGIRRPRPPIAPASVAPAFSTPALLSLLKTLPIPPVPLELDRGAVWRGAPGRARLWVEGLYAEAEPLPGGGWRLRLEGSPWGRGKASLSASCGPGFSSPTAGAEARGLEWPAWALPGPWNGLQGRLSGTLSARSRSGAWPDGWDLKADGVVDGAALSAGAGRPGVSGLRVRWSLRGGRLNFAAQGACAGGRIAGRGWIGLDSRVLDLTVTARGSDLGALALAVGAPKELGLSGPADLSFTASGPFAAPRLGADLSSGAALWKGHPLTGLDLKAMGGAGVWSALGSLAWDQGHGRVSLDMDSRGLAQASLQVSALPADWLDAFVAADLRGRLDGEGSFTHRSGAWSVSLQGAHLSLGTLDLLHAGLTASGGASSARARVEAVLPGRPGFSVDLGLQFPEPGRWTLKQARFFRDDALLARAWGEGRLGRDGIPGDLSLTVKAPSLDLGALDPDWAARGWSGRLGIRARVRRVGGAWSGQAHVFSRSLARGGWGYPGSADLGFGPGGVHVALDALRGGEVTGRLSAPGWRGPWSARLGLERARLAAYTALGLGIPSGVSGWASGSLEFDAAPPGRLRARLDFSDPLPALLPKAVGRLELSREGTRWSLDALKFKQGTGSAQGAARWDGGGPGPWTGALNWRDLDLAGRRTSGVARLSGGGRAPGRFSVSPWSLSGAALPALAADFGFGKGGLDGVRGVLGSGASWSAARKSGGWALRTGLKDFDPGPLASLAPGGVSRPSPIRLSGKAEAVFGPDVRPRGVSADLGGPDGARLKGRCLWVSGTAAVRVSFDALNLGTLARDLGPLGWRLPSWTGVASGSLAGSGEALTLTAAVGRLAWGARDLGPLSLVLGWDRASVWVPSLRLGEDSGPFLGLNGAVWKGSPKDWTASGGLSLTDWPVGIWTLGGAARAWASGGGSTLRWTARFKPLLAGLRRWPDCSLRGSWDGGKFQVRDASRNPRFTASGTCADGGFTLDHLRVQDGGGSGSVSGRLGADGSLGFEAGSQGLPAADLTGVMGWPQDWSGSAWGSVRVSGSLGKPHTVVSVKLEHGSVDGLPFDLGTALVVQDGGWVNLSPSLPIRVSRRDGTAFEVGGRVPLDYRPSAGRVMDVWAELRHGGLGLLAGLPAVRHAQGPLSLKLRFRGDPDDPRVDGEFVVMDGSLDPAWLLPEFTGVRVLARIADSKVSLPEAEARAVGDGRMLRVSAADPDKPAFVFRDWVPADMNLRIRSGPSGISVRNTRALSFAGGVAHPDLTLAGSWDRPTLGGSVRLERGGADKALIQWPPEFPKGPGGLGGVSWFDRLGYHLVLKARGDVMVRTGAAGVFVDTGDQGLLVESVGADKRLYGRLRLLQGSVDYLLATFQLAQDHESSLDFHGGDAPVLELWGLDDLGNVSLAGAAGAEDVQVLLHAWGPLGGIQTRLVDQDDPSLTQDQLAGLIGMGGDSGDPRSQGGFTRMLGSLPANLLTAWARKTGLLDELSVSVPALDQAVAPTPEAGIGDASAQPLAQTTPTSSTARSLLELSAGRYLGSKVFVGVDTQVIQRPVIQGGTQFDPELGGVVQYQLPGSARLSAERNIDDTGVADNRVMLEGTSHFDNYDPARRRWDGTPTPTPTPAPSPLPAP